MQKKYKIKSLTKIKQQSSMKLPYQNLQQWQQQQNDQDQQLNSLQTNKISISRAKSHKQQRQSDISLVRINRDHIKIVALIVIVVILWICVMNLNVSTTAHQNQQEYIDRKRIRQQKIKHKKQQKMLLELVHRYHNAEANQISNQLRNMRRYYDLYSFLGSYQQSQYSPIQVLKHLGNVGDEIVIRHANLSENQVNYQRDILQITSTKDQIQQVIKTMISPPYRRQSNLKKQQENYMSPQVENLAYFYKQLSLNQNKRQYLQAEYYRYDKLYNISQYGKQLPLCIVIAGKNNQRHVQKLLKSIQSQNYTNYHIVYVDDASSDKTLDNVLKYLANSNQYFQQQKIKRQPSSFQHKLTLLTQKYQRNALYNRNLGVMKYCAEEDIVIDVDADDYLIGRQVFQLVNTIYQTGINLQENNHEVWCAYFGNVADLNGVPLVALYGQIDPQILETNSYRIRGKWRTTQLRTYRKQLYNKVDKKDLIDKHALKQGQFYVQSYDVFMQTGMVQMSGPKHMRILDQFVYFYRGSPSKMEFVESEYSNKVGKTLMPYKRLQKLSDNPQRYDIIPQNQQQIYDQLVEKRQKYTQQLKTKLQKLQQQITQRYKKQKENKRIN